MPGTKKTWCQRVLCLLAVASGGSAGCAGDESSENPKSRESRVYEVFDAFLLGVQQAENLSGLSKERGELDMSTEPPTYPLAYSGCTAGVVSGEVCIEDGVQIIAVLDGGTNIITSLEQTYRFTDYADGDDYVLTGSLAVTVAVEVDPVNETTSIDGSAAGTLAIEGALQGDAEFTVSIAGGRVYTQDVSTEIELAGEMVFDDNAYDVRGGFARG